MLKEAIACMHPGCHGLLRCGQHTTVSQLVDQWHLDGRWTREENEAKEEAKQRLES